MIAQYFNDTLAAGIAVQNQIFAAMGELLMGAGQRDAAQAAALMSLRRDGGRGTGCIYLLPLPKSGGEMIAAAPSPRLLSWCGKVSAPGRAVPFPRQPGQKVKHTGLFRLRSKSSVPRGNIPPLETPANFGSHVVKDFKNAIQPTPKC